MITQLRFKNWRSLKDVTIDDLGKITVFIGANSSGKTNIVDALYFWRHSLNAGILQAVFDWKVNTKVRTFGVPENAALELELTYLLNQDRRLTEIMSLQFHKQDMPYRFKSGHKLIDNGIEILNELDEIPPPQIPWSSATRTPEQREAEEMIDLFVQQRWQMLDENFMPRLGLSSEETGDVYLLDRCADNLLFALNFMQQTNPELYDNLQNDFRWLLSYVDQITTERDERETRLKLTEKFHAEYEAPSVSAGTSRILAMLTAVYALDMRLKDTPGLIVIEEPDTALNPGLLRRFVEQIRTYAEGENSRQFIFTTHNPTFLDFFEPEEVRVVERDENGYTTVNKIPDYIREIWLKDGEYGLGEVWTTRSFGGVPE